MARPTPHLLAACGPADADLLARFADHRDAGALELLIWRHAPLVLRVGRAVLRDRHAAEDCAQAVFLALARQAGSVRGDTLPGWLFRVARRVAIRAARRQPPPPAPADLDNVPVAAASAGPDPAEVRALHDELPRLPEAYRTPVLLCFFEGLTHTEAARRLGWPVGTVAGRLARAKTTLGLRLTRRGLAPALLAAAVEAVPPGFAGATADAALAYVTGRGVGVPAPVAELATGEVRRVAVTKTARLAGTALACGAVVLGIGFAWGGDAPAPQPAAQPPVPAPAPAAPVPAPPKAFIGKTFAVAPVTTDLQRRLLGAGHPTLTVFVSIDGNALFPEPDSLNLEALDIQGIRAALREYLPAADRRVHFETGYSQHPSPNRVGKELVASGLEGLGLQLGFGQAVASSLQHHESWSTRIAPLRSEADAAATETAVGDARAQAFPVRTPLSQLLTRQARGVVDVRTPIDVRPGTPIPAGLDEPVRAALRALRLPPGSRVNFLFERNGRDDGNGDRLLSLAQGWAEGQGLGFGMYSAR